MTTKQRNIRENRLPSTEILWKQLLQKNKIKKRYLKSNKSQYKCGNLSLSKYMIVLERIILGHNYCKLFQKPLSLENNDA